MKVLLLNPPMYYGAYNQAGKVYLDKSYPPLGLAYMGALLKKEGFTVQVLDLVDTPFQEAKKIIEDQLGKGAKSNNVKFYETRDRSAPCILHLEETMTCPSP